MDAGTGLTILGSAIGSAKLLEKFLGPTADYLGVGLKNWSEKRFDNLKRIFDNAINKTGANIDVDAQVPPKVLRGTLSDGSFADDIISIEYYGGVLASSRSGISRDDRGVYFNSMIGKLSSYQLRSHYIFYHCFYQIFKGSNNNVAIADNISKMEIYIPYPEYFKSLDLVDEEYANLPSLINHILFGLSKENLIKDHLVFGSKEHLSKYYKDAPESGILIQPSTLGVELFLWAFGKGNTPIQDFYDTRNNFDLDDNIKLPNTIIKTKGTS